MKEMKSKQIFQINNVYYILTLLDAFSLQQTYIWYQKMQNINYRHGGTLI